MAAETDLRLVITALFPNRAELDRTIGAIRGFQLGQEQANQKAIEQNKRVIEQMIRMGQLSGEQLTAANRYVAALREQETLVKSIARSMAASNPGGLGPDKANPGWGRSWGGAPGMGVFGPEIGQAGTEALANLYANHPDAKRVQRLLNAAGDVGGSSISAGSGSSISAQLRTATREANLLSEGAEKAANSINHIGSQGKFAVRVLEAFALYRGFVFLEQGAINVTRTLIDLQHQVSLILTQLPNFGEGMRGVVTQGIIDNAKQSGQSFQQVGDALYQIASAGYDAHEALTALSITTKAAVAGGTDASNAFNAALAQMSAFGLANDRLEEVYDKQFNLVRRGIFTYQQLTTVVGITAEAFYQAGQSMETANASLAAVSEVFTGPQLTRGATALRNLALAVADKSADFEALGVYTRDAEGNVRDLIPIVEELGVVLNKLPTGERATAISSILPDKRERGAVLALIQNMDSLKRNYVEQELALGSLDKAYEKVNLDAKVQAGILAASVESGFRPMANTVGEIIYGLNALDGILPGFTASLLASTAAMSALAVAQAFLNSQTMIAVQSSSLATRALETEMVAATRLTAIKQVLSSPGFRIGAVGIGAFALSSAGANATDFNPVAGLASAAGGAIAGGLAAGVPGAIVGGIAAAAPYLTAAFTGSFRHAAEEGGKTLADTFGEELKNSGSIQQAFQTAVASASATGMTSSLGMALSGIAKGNLTLGGGSFLQKDLWAAEPGWAQKNGLLNSFYGLGAGIGTGVNNFGEWLGVPKDLIYDRSSYSSTNIMGATGAAAAARSSGGIDELLRLNKSSGTPLDDATIGAIRKNLAIESVGKMYDPVIESLKAIAASGDEQAKGQLEAIEATKSFAIALADSTLSTEDFAKVQEIAADQTKTEAQRSFEIMQLMSKQMAGVPEAVKENLDLSSNSLADALFHAADVVRYGLSANAAYTADELEMLGESFDDLNRAVKKVGLLKELQGIGEFLGMDKGFLEPAMKEVLEAAKLGGQDLRKLLGDPAKLMEFLDSLIQFGDVKVDQSTHNSIVVRISGDTDLKTLDAAKAADALLRELNNKQRATH